MSRIRTIKPDFFLDEEVADLDPVVRLLFIGLWTIADRAGRLEDRPRRIKIQLLPYDDVDIDALLGTLVGAGFIIRYQSESGQKLIEIKSFCAHQRPNVREPESTLPAPSEHTGARARTCTHMQEHSEHDSAHARTGGREGNGSREGNGEREGRGECEGGGKAAAAPRALAKGRRWGDGEIVPVAWLEWARSVEGLSAAVAEREAERFCDYWRAVPGSRGIKRDWCATWRNWARRAKDGNGKAAGYETPADRIKRLNDPGGASGWDASERHAPTVVPPRR